MKKISSASAQIWYLDHSGFAVKTENRLLIFDYYNKKPLDGAWGLESGTIEPEELEAQDVFVFASHVHGDHYTPDVLEWEQFNPRLYYILSHDIINQESGKNITAVFPNREYNIGELKVRTLKSTDEGVAFIVEVDGLKIYHAGDLNWWHWEGDPQEVNEAMAQEYKKQIDLLRGESFDLAFIPVDPRLENEYLWGIDYFMRLANTRMVFPMHFWNDYSIFDRLNNDPKTKAYRDKIKVIKRRGELFEYMG